MNVSLGIPNMRLTVFHVALALAATLTLEPASSTSATSLRNGVGGEQDPGHLKLANSLWPFHGDDDDTEGGITFERTDTACPLIPGQMTLWRKVTSRFPRRLTLSLDYVFEFIPAQLRVQSAPQPSPHAIFNDGHCEVSDIFGDNNCHYNWGDDITIDYDGWIGEQLDDDVYIEISAKIGSLFYHTQTCPICGDDPCSINLPLVSYWNWSIELPPCPLTPEFLSGNLKRKLPDKSPIPGFLVGGSGAVVEGTVALKKKADQEGAEELVMMQVKGNVHVK